MVKSGYAYGTVCILLESGGHTLLHRLAGMPPQPVETVQEVEDASVAYVLQICGSLGVEKCLLAPDP
jgi:hypothetical protein